MHALLLAIAIAFPATPPAAITSGVASYYADPAAPQGSLYAAMPGMRDGHPFYVTVRRGSRKVRVKVITQCQCHVGRRDERLIDLSWTAFARLAGGSLRAGLLIVTVER